MKTIIIKTAKDEQGNWIGFNRNGNVVMSNDNGYRAVREHESIEFVADSVLNLVESEWEELDGAVYFHPESEWVRTEETTM